MLGIKSFTPAITEIFNLIESDYGRPVTDIVTKLSYENFERDVRKVMRTLTRVEQEVTVADGSATYMTRILPYRTVDNVIDGVVITFIDITERKRSEEDRARLAAIVASSYDAIIGLTPEGTITSWNAGAERIYAYTSEEAVGQPWSMIMGVSRSTEMRTILERSTARCGCEVVGPMGRVARAEHARRVRKTSTAPSSTSISPASRSRPVAQVLAERAIPFVFVTGCGEAGADERFAERPVLKKPFRPEELREALLRLAAEDGTARYAHLAGPPASLPLKTSRRESCARTRKCPGHQNGKDEDGESAPSERFGCKSECFRYVLVKIA